MVDLVQVACNKVEKYDKNGVLCYIFNSVNECSNNDKISPYIIRHHQDIEHLYNGYFYKTIKPKPYITKAICDWCGKEFDCQRFRTEDGRKHIFCSNKCRAEFQKSQTELNCICKICGKHYHAPQSHINNYGSRYCSKRCADKAKEIYMKGKGNHQFGLKGDKNASWKSDERLSSYGYKLIRKLNHPFRNSDGFVFEHRLVAEKYLLNDENSVIIDGKRYLSPHCIVHHLDFDRLNNDPDNLLIMNESEHMKLHQRLKDDKELQKYCDEYNIDKNIIINRQRKYVK